MRHTHHILMAVLAAALAAGCAEKWPAEPDWSRIPDPSKQQEEEEDQGFPKPGPCTNKVVAHRGGSAECGEPDNSLAALRYTMGIKAYAAECDVYWTSDDNVIVAHADGDYHVNGLAPYEHTVAEIRAKGKLPNGEDIPTLKEYLEAVMVKGSCTKLMIDIKKLDSSHLDYVAKCAKKTCDIIDEMKAKHFVDLLCTGTNENIMKIAFGYAQKSGVEIGMNSGKSPAQYNSLGFKWANMSAATGMGPEAGGTGSIDPKKYLDAGVAVSVYSVDKQRFNGDSVYSEKAWDYYLSNLSMFKVITSNYPAWLIARLEKVSRTYDGISNLEEFKVFAEEVRSDPTAKRFQDSDGKVVLKADLALDNFAPLAAFSGTFDGGGRTITIKYSGSDSKVGLFKSLSGTVRDLNLAGSISIGDGEGEAHVGAFAAEATAATLENCTSTVSITVAENLATASRCFVTGGLIGKVTDGCTIKGCTSSGNMRFTSPGYCLLGGLIGGSAADNGTSSVKDCKFTGSLIYSGSNVSDWHYVGGLTGKMQSALLTGTTYGLEISGCECSGTISLAGKAKIRAGGIASYAKACNLISGCTFSGRIEIGAASQERNVGGICGFQETSCNALIRDCTFSGGIVCASGAGKAYWVGGIISTGYSAASHIESCRTTGSCSVQNQSLGSVGMVAARPNSAVTISGCRIAGTIGKGSESITLTGSNLEDWMFKGSATEDSRGVVIENCGYNE